MITGRHHCEQHSQYIATVDAHSVSHRNFDSEHICWAADERTLVVERECYSCEQARVLLQPIFSSTKAEGSDIIILQGLRLQTIDLYPD